MLKQTLKTNKLGFGFIEPLIVIVVVCVVGIGAWLSFSKTRSIQTDSQHVVLAELDDSGSTNAAGWNLTIYGDGSASFTCQTKSERRTACKSTSYKPSTVDAAGLKSALDTVQLQSQYQCVRSASFGSTQTLLYKNTTTVGINCYFGANPGSAVTKAMEPILQKISS